MNLGAMMGRSLLAAIGMFWSIFWALVLGFALSSFVLVFIPKRGIREALGSPGPKEIALATFLGAVSSSCSYAASSMSRSLFQKGAHIIPALAFLLASTNLVLELSIILGLMMGWQFVAAEVAGGILMIGIMALLMRLVGPLQRFEDRRIILNREAAHETSREPKSGAGSPEAVMPAIFSRDGPRQMARAFVSEWKMIGKDIAIGIGISGILMVCVPDSFWGSLFLRAKGPEGPAEGLLRLLENAMMGPLVSMLSFVCSVGNIPLAAVLYRGGIRFGGALSFIYADLLIVPLILIYRRQYGTRLALAITGVFYAAMVISGVLVDLLFSALHWVPAPKALPMEGAGMGFFQINYTFWLNLAFSALAASLVWLSRTGAEPEADDHCCHAE